MAFIPLERLNEIIFYLEKEIPINEFSEKIMKFWKYFNKTWIPIAEIWNHFENVNRAPTNNHVEGYNLKIQLQIGVNHPNIYSLIDNIKELECL